MDVSNQNLVALGPHSLSGLPLSALESVGMRSNLSFFRGAARDKNLVWPWHQDFRQLSELQLKNLHASGKLNSKTLTAFGS